MQTLARTSSVGTAYSQAQVLSQMSSPAKVERWIFDRLDRNGKYTADFTPYMDLQQAPVIVHDTKRAVKRTLQMRVAGSAAASMKQLSDIIRPRYQLVMPDGGTVEWALGQFVLPLFDKDILKARTWLTCTALDLTQLLVDGRFLTTYSAPSGVSYVTAIASGLATMSGRVLEVQITEPGVKIPAALSYVRGTSRLLFANELLNAVNLEEAWVDGNGRLRSRPLPDASSVRPTVTFDATQPGCLILGPAMTDKPDMTNAFNQCLVTSTDPRRPGIWGFYENKSPSSKISTVNWHPVLKEIKDSTIPDAATAQARARLEIQAAARVESVLTLATYPWPVSEQNDVYGVIFQTPDEGLVSATYLEISWTHTCRQGAPTVHQLKRVIAT